MGIRKKIIIILILFSLSSVVVYLTSIYLNTRSFFLNTNLQLLQKDNFQYASEITNFFADVKNDVAVIAPEFEFTTGNGSVLTSSSAKTIEEDFKNIMDIHKFYYQMRYIDENGNEIIRVSYDKKTGFAKIVPPAELQNKKDRPYFPETIKLSKGEFYVSSLDLDREGNPPAIITPYIPIIRLAIPIFDDKNNKKGILIANIFAEDFLQFLLKNSKDQTSLLLDVNGYYLSSPDKHKLWGNPENLNTGYNYKKDFPKLADQVLSRKNGIIINEDQIISFTPIFLDGSSERSFILVTSIPQHIALLPTNTILGQVIFYTFILTFIIVIIFSFFIRRFFDPLDVLTKSAKRISEGDLDQTIAISSNDEIGQLSQAFNDMVIKLKDLYKGLEEKINERTKELTNNILKLEDTKKATLNLLEDVKAEKDKSEEQKNLFLSLINNSPIGVFVVKAPNGEAIIMNSIGEALSGRRIDQSVNKQRYSEFFNLVNEDGSIYLNQNLPTVKALEQGEIFTASDIFIQRPNGIRIALKVTSAPVRDQTGKISMVVTVFEDITREKEIDKMKTEFVGLASHQLRSPLVAMKWLLEVLLAKDTGELNQEQMGLIHDIDVSNQRMIDLVNIFLNVSNIESGKLKLEPKPTNLKILMAEVQKALEDQIQLKNHNFTVNISGDLPLVNIDPKLIKEVYLNLLGNSIEYTPPGGKISLTISLKDGEIISQISDNGYGIPERNQKDIYNKFYRGENIVKKFPNGSGLGLYFVKAIVELSHGKIWLQSKEGEGTTFWFSLPINNSSTIQ